MKGTTSESKVTRRRIIERPRLLRLLEESHARVKMLVAPAGYGKTTLARQWLAFGAGPVMWVSASPAAADVAVLFRDVCRALARIAPGTEDRLRQRLAVTADPEAEWRVLAEMLVEDVGSLESPPCLAIDDYHALAASEAAESIVGEIAHSGVCDVLIVGRSRPSWVSARQILYGEVLELGQNVLAMTNDEADAAFADDGPLSPGLVHLAQGWPAVLALAARTPTSGFPEGGDALPETLHAFFAEELYQSLDPAVQRGLTRVALAEIEDVATAREFFDDLDGALEQAASVGWISDPHADAIDLHPLLRAFLRRKLERDEPEEFRAACETTATVLIERGRWDEAGRLIVEQKLHAMLIPLLEASLESLLSQGRLATLRDWVVLCTESGLDAAAVRVAAAELAFREGRFFEAEVLAASVPKLAVSDRLRFLALELAGRGAHIGSHELQALEYFRVARSKATTREEYEVAALGELAAAIDLELEEAQDLYAELERDSDRRSPDQKVTLVARGIALDSRFANSPRLNQARRTHQLLSAVRDPIVRSSFRNVFAYSLAQSGACREAWNVVGEQRRDVATYRLAFAASYTDLIVALIQVVEGDFEAADVLLTDVESVGRESGDWYLVASALCHRARSLISRGAFEEASMQTLQRVGPVPRGMAAEIWATRALAFACAHRHADAMAAVDEATRSSGIAEVALLNASTRAVIATQASESEAFFFAREALRLSGRLSSIEGFLAAVRGCPEVGALLWDASETRRELMLVLAPANEIARFEGRGEPASANSWNDLSKRQQEVLQLVAHGMRNSEIAAALFITEGTVKLHVHHILERLGVRSRTAAALRVPPHARARQPPLDGGSSASPD